MEGDAEAELIGARVRHLPEVLLRGHVRRRPEDGPGLGEGLVEGGGGALVRRGVFGPAGPARQTEIGDTRVRRAHEDVSGEIAVHETAACAAAGRAAASEYIATIARAARAARSASAAASPRRRTPSR